VKSVIRGLLPAFGLSQRRPWVPGERDAWHHPGMKGTKAILFRGITSTNIVGGIPLLRAHRVLRASLSCPHYSSGKAILDGLIRAAFENRKESSHGGHGGHGGCVESVNRRLLPAFGLSERRP